MTRFDPNDPAYKEIVLELGMRKLFWHLYADKRDLVVSTDFYPVGSPIPLNHPWWLLAYDQFEGEVRGFGHYQDHHIATEFGPTPALALQNALDAYLFKRAYV